MDRTLVRPEAGARCTELVPRLLMALATALLLCCPISGVSAAVLALADSSAAADTSAAPGGVGGSGVEVAVSGSSPGEKSGMTALLASFLGTTVLGGAAVLTKSSSGRNGPTAALGVTAYLIGPSVGHFYAGRPARAWIGIGFRSLIGVGYGLALLTLIVEGSDNDLTGLSGVIAGLAAGATVFDIVAAPRSARLHNIEVRRLAISPTAVGGAPGVRVDAGF